VSNPTYSIAKWQETFETSESKRYKNLTWVSLPIGLNSNGYHELVFQFGEEAPAIYGAWCALLAVAAQAPVRGTLASSKGPYTLARIAVETRMPEVVFAKLFKWALQPEVGWLVECHPTITQQSNDNDRLNVVLHNPTLPNITLHNQETICGETAEPSSPPPVPEEVPVMEFPCDGTRGMGKTWRLYPSYVKELQAAFPSIDVEQQCRQALLWLNAEPSRRKTANGMKKFLSGWMGRSQNKGSPARQVGFGSPDPRYKRREL